MPFFTGIRELTVSAAERCFRWQEDFFLYCLLNCGCDPDEPFKIVFRPLRIVG
jgi:hypothetical protein